MDVKDSCLANVKECETTRRAESVWVQKRKAQVRQLAKVVYLYSIFAAGAPFIDYDNSIVVVKPLFVDY